MEQQVIPTEQFSNGVSQESYNGILHLNQKLESLLQDIEVTTQDLDKKKMQDLEQRKTQLLALATEIKRALAGMKDVVNLVNDKVPG